MSHNLLLTPCGSVLIAEAQKSLKPLQNIKIVRRIGATKTGQASNIGFRLEGERI